MTLLDAPRLLEACNYRLAKTAAKGSLKHGFTGKLILSESGWLLLTVPNAIVRGMFDALEEPGVELPPSGPGGKLDAHISIMRPEELKQLGGADKITERGQSFAYRLGRTRSFAPSGWQDMSRVWTIDVISPELRKLRKTYGLTPLPNENKHKLHVAFAVRRRNVLQENETSKAAYSPEPINKWTKGLAIGDEYAFVEYIICHNEEDCDSGELDGLSDKEIRRLRREWQGLSTKVKLQYHRKTAEMDPSYSPEHPKECCPHCGARLERGDDGSCNRCGKSWKGGYNNNVIAKSAILGKFAGDTTKEIAQAEAETDTKPTPAQIEAGNYKKGKVTLHGLEISIENPKGSTRSGTSADGKKWSQKMHATYGYVRGTEAKDGDQVDVFIGPDPDSELVFVVNQVDPKTKKYDEPKVMLGYTTQDAAKKGYLANYEKDWDGMGSVTPMTIQQFKWWLDKGNTKKEIKGGFFASKVVKVANIERLRKAKKESDRGNYPAKHRILREAMEEDPDSFEVDDTKKRYHGITHTPSGFRLHTDPAQIPAGIKRKTAVAKKQPEGYLAESAKIRVNQKSKGAKPHDFEAAEWTHPNGHPRCLWCGDEEREDGKCGGHEKTAVSRHSRTRTEEYDVCEHCGKEIGEKALYQDPEGNWFHRPCMDAGPIKMAAAQPFWKRTLNTQLAQPTWTPGVGIIGNLGTNFRQARERGLRMVNDQQAYEDMRASMNPGFGYKRLQAILGGQYKPVVSNPIDRLLFQPHL